MTKRKLIEQLSDGEFHDISPDMWECIDVLSDKVAYESGSGSLIITLGDDDSYELDRCPFCGGYATVVDGSFPEEAPYWHASCDDCTAEIEGFSTKKEAIEAWNKRVKGGNKYV